MSGWGDPAERPRRRWRTLLRVARGLVRHQVPVGTPPPREPPEARRHLPAVGLVTGYRIREGAGDAVVDWLDRRLATRGHRLVPAAALPATAAPGPGVPPAVVLVQPLDVRAAPAVVWPASVGPGGVVGLVGYGPPETHALGLDRRREQIRSRGASTAREVVLIDVDDLRASGAPSPFEQIALDALLDALIPPTRDPRPCASRR